MIDPAQLTAFAASCQTESPPPPAARLLSIWEITSWILPMAPEHLRRVLAADPNLPQGQAGTDGGTRWFTPAEVATLRAHFAQGPRRARYQPQLPATAPLVVLAQPLGQAGRSRAAQDLASAAALAGWRVLLIDAAPEGHLARDLGCAPAPGAGLLSLLAKSAGQHLRRANEARLDRGEPPLPMPDLLAEAQGQSAADLIRPSRWPGLEVLAAQDLLQADAQIAGWQMQMRGWRPGQALMAICQDEGLRRRYDLILLDPGRGLGPLALTALVAADLLLAPLPLQQGALARLGAGLAGLAAAGAALQAEAQMTARALGQTAAPLPWQRLLVLPMGISTLGSSGIGPAENLLPGFAAKLGELPAGAVLLPNGLPASPAPLYDLDYRDLGRQSYTPLREAGEAAWQGLAAQLVAEAAVHPRLL